MQQFQQQIEAYSGGQGYQDIRPMRRRDSDPMYSNDEDGDGVNQPNGGSDLSKRKKKKDDKVPFTPEVSDRNSIINFRNSYLS